MAGGMITAASGYDPASGMLVGASLGYGAGDRLGRGVGGIGSLGRQVKANGRTGRKV